MNQQQQIHYWTHMLDEAFSANLNGMKSGDKFVSQHEYNGEITSNNTKSCLFKMVEESGTSDASKKFESALYNLEQTLYRKLSDGIYRYHDIEYILGEIRHMWNAQHDDTGRSAVLAKIQDPEAFIENWKSVDEGITSESKRQILYWAHMLDEAFCKGQLLTEGKHWPEDYIKTAYNTIKSSPLGQQSWYTDEYLTRDLIGPPIDPNLTKQEPVHDINRIDKSDLAHNANKYGILGDFSPLMHKNSNLGFFATIVRWFIEYAGTSKEKYQEFIERKLDGVIGTLQTVLSDPQYDKIKDEIKQKWTFAQFEELQKKIADEAKTSSDEKLKGLVKRDDYDLIPIYSYEELHEKFGGSWTGYKGQSEWCHTNGKSTYESWTKDGTEMFFVLAKKDWKDIKVPAQKPNKEDNAYDEYGLSLIAILVDVAAGNLLNETLRWNHVIEPSAANPGASVDKAFKNNWGALSQAVGMDVKAACEKECKDLKRKLQEKADAANKQVEEILKGKTEIDEDTIPKSLKKHLTKVVIPNSVTSIGKWAFDNCSGLESVTIPDSVMSIGNRAFDGCNSLTSMTIPDNVTSIGDYVFFGCSRLTSMTIPDNVTSIGDSAFRSCRGLTSVMIPNSVTSIGNYTFGQCSRLASMTIPDSVTSIGDFAFYDCSSLTSMIIGNSVADIGNRAFFNCNNLKQLVFKGQSLEEVKAMWNYPWGIRDKSIIKCEGSLNESKATYLQKYRDEADAKKIVDAFWQIKSRLSAPQNDIDWWIKKPFADLKSFVLNYNPANKKQRRDADYRKQALENDAKLLDTRDGYEIWYVPTYEAMRILGRFYKGRSAKWCVASDDPEFWFDNHDEDEFVVLVREQPKNDEFDKVALQMTSHGRYFSQKQIIPWDLENNDNTFTARYYMTGLDLEGVEDLIYYAWQLFKDNGEQREQYYEVD